MVGQLSKRVGGAGRHCGATVAAAADGRHMRIGHKWGGSGFRRLLNMCLPVIISGKQAER